MAEREEKREKGRRDGKVVRAAGDGMNVDEPKVPLRAPGLLHEVELTIIFLRPKRK